MPTVSDSSAIECVVFLVQHVPSIGSPATSSLRISSILAWIAPFLFPPLRGRHPPCEPALNRYLPPQQLDPTFGNRVRVDSKQGGHACITTSADFQCLQAREQPALRFE